MGNSSLFVMCVSETAAAEEEEMEEKEEEEEEEEKEEEEAKEEEEEEENEEEEEGECWRFSHGRVRDQAWACDLRTHQGKYCTICTEVCQ